MTLTPVSQNDLRTLRQIETSENLAFRWRYHGAHPSPQEYESLFWSNTLCSFLVSDAERPVGLVLAYDADFANQHCHIAAARFEENYGRFSVLTGIFLLTHYLFAGWPFRKLYFESHALNALQFDRAPRDAVHREARLRDHVFVDGSYRDVLIYAIYRDPWLSYSNRWLVR